jgi:hypothetical protein
MRPAWWRMMCEHGHVWEQFGLEGARPDDVGVCPGCGEEPVTVSCHPVADRVHIRFVPAAWVVQEPTPAREEVVWDKRFYVEIAPWSGGETLRTTNAFRWEEAVSVGQRFEGATWEQAQKLWRVGNLHRMTPSR